MELRLLGTSHIAAESIKEITHIVETWKPDIIAVELDIERAASLFTEEKRRVSLAIVREVGVKGYLFAKIGQIVQQKLGQSVGIAPGAEMKTALELAKKHKLQTELIDQPIKITLARFSKSLTWKEKYRFVEEIVLGLLFPKRQMKKLGFTQFDLRKVPSKELIEKMMGHFQERYPSVYKTLLEDRNRYMVRQLVRLMKEYPGKKILAVVGAGHEKGMRELLLKVDIVR